MPIDIKETFDIYLVIRMNKDNEKYTCIQTIYWCRLKATALRLAQESGSGCTVTKSIGVLMLGTDEPYYGPIHLTLPSSDDVNKQSTVDMQDSLIVRMLESGFTEEEIQLIRLK